VAHWGPLSFRRINENENKKIINNVPLSAVVRRVKKNPDIPPPAFIVEERSKK